MGQLFLAVLISQPEMSVVKAVAHLDKNFSWIQVVRAAKREAVIEQNPPIGNIDSLDAQRESLAELLAE